jgi:hypothetical protein
MKIITISVSEDFSLPSVYEGGGLKCELALTIGARVVEEIQLPVEDISGDMAKILHRERENCRRLIEAEKQHVLQQQRELILIEKEKAANDRETIISRIEERHTQSVARTEENHRNQLSDLRRSFDQLRSEHEGLVLKLMSRLETTRNVASAASLGRSFEDSVQLHLRQTFGARSGFHLEDVHTTGHTGDLIMIFDNLRILIELKSYDPKTRVPSKEVEKLARDLAEVQPSCDAGIMISACSEITGHYSCGPLEVSASAACVPVLFVNNFLSLGDPQVTLHMTRVFLTMVTLSAETAKNAKIAQDALLPENREEAEAEKFRRLERVNNECARRCTGYLSDLSRQSAELIRQATAMKNGAVKLKETVIILIETEVSRFNGIIQLVASSETHQVTDVPKNLSIFNDTALLSEENKRLIAEISSTYEVGEQHRCPTKEILGFIQSTMKISSEKPARDLMKLIFNETVLKHGYIAGLAKKSV